MAQQPNILSDLSLIERSPSLQNRVQQALERDPKTFSDRVQSKICPLHEDRVVMAKKGSNFCSKCSSNATSIRLDAALENKNRAAETQREKDLIKFKALTTTSKREALAKRKRHLEELAKLKAEEDELDAELAKFSNESEQFAPITVKTEGNKKGSGAVPRAPNTVDSIDDAMQNVRVNHFAAAMPDNLFAWLMQDGRLAPSKHSPLLTQPRNGPFAAFCKPSPLPLQSSNMEALQKRPRTSFEVSDAQLKKEELASEMAGLREEAELRRTGQSILLE